MTTTGHIYLRPHAIVIQCGTSPQVMIKLMRLSHFMAADVTPQSLIGYVFVSGNRWAVCTLAVP
jgi:hypothetical protein